MRRISRWAVVTLFVGLLSLLPVNALAVPFIQEYVLGFEYAVGTCEGGDSGSFAGIGSPAQGAQPDGVFDTTICHSPFDADRKARILSGTFTLATSSAKLTGIYVSGTVGPGVVGPLYSGSEALCKEDFPVYASLAPSANQFPGFQPWIAVGTLTHIGLFAATGGCQAFGAVFAGGAVLYP